MIKNGRFWTQKFDLALNLNIFDEIRGPRSISEVGRSHFWTFWVHFGRFRRFWVLDQAGVVKLVLCARGVIFSDFPEYSEINKTVTVRTCV